MRGSPTKFCSGPSCPSNGNTATYRGVRAGRRIVKNVRHDRLLPCWKRAWGRAKGGEGWAWAETPGPGPVADPRTPPNRPRSGGHSPARCRPTTPARICRRRSPQPTTNVVSSRAHDRPPSRYLVRFGLCRTNGLPPSREAGESDGSYRCRPSAGSGSGKSGVPAHVQHGPVKAGPARQSGMLSRNPARRSGHITWASWHPAARSYRSWGHGLTVRITVILPGGG